MSGGPAGVVWPPPGEVGQGPLAGVKVLDLTAFAVGPWAVSQLANLGADVLKIEPPHGDGLRLVQPTKKGEPTTYTVCNLGKRSVVLDLKNPSQLSVALALADQADVIVENSKAGVMERLGIGYARVAESNPGVVYCSSSSFGDAGPLAGVGSTDPQGQAFTGFVSINGMPGERPQLLRYSALIDLTTSMCIVQAVLIGLYERRRSGRGQHVKTSQMEAGIALQTSRIAEFLETGSNPTTRGSGVDGLVPSRAFQCLDERFIAVTAHTPEAWTGLCSVLGRVDLRDDPRFATNSQRVGHREELEAILEEGFGQRPSIWWLPRLADNGVPSAPFLLLEDAEHHAHARDNGFVVRLPHPEGGTISSGGLLWRFDRTPAGMRAPSPVGDGAELLGWEADE